jgi:hypothetical protein
MNEALQKDRETIYGLLKEVKALLDECTSTMPKSTDSSRSFRRASVRHVARYKKEIDKLLEKSALIRYQTPIGAVIGSTIDRVLTLKKLELDYYAQFIKTLDEKHRIAHEQTAQEAVQLINAASILDANSETLNEDLADLIARSFLIEKEVGVDGGPRGTIKA